MPDHLGHCGVGGAGRSLSIEQPHRAAVAIAALEPIDGGDPLGDAHRIGLDEGPPLVVRALGSRANSVKTIGTLTLAGSRAANIFRTVGTMLIKIGFRADIVGDAAKHLIGMQDDIVEMILGPRLDRPLQIVHVDRFGGQPDEAVGIDPLRGVVRGDDELGIVGRRLIAAGAVGGLVPDLEVVRLSLDVPGQLRHIARPGRKIVDGQGARPIELVPAGVAGEDRAESDLVVGQVLHLLVERSPIPFPLLGLDGIPVGVARPIVVDSDGRHLGNPAGVVFDRAIVDVATADAERTERRARSASGRALGRGSSGKSRRGNGKNRRRRTGEPGQDDGCKGESIFHGNPLLRGFGQA